jgi:Tfp pilus assembly protein FimT
LDTHERVSVERSLAPVHGVATSQIPRMNRMGMTLLELTLALVLVGLLTALAVPSGRSLLSSGNVRLATLDLLSALDAARTSAIRRGTPVELVDAGTAFVVRLRGDTTATWTGRHPSRRAVNLSGFGSPIAFGPDGLGWGVANRTLTLVGTATSSRVVLSRLGRIR